MIENTQKRHQEILDKVKVIAIGITIAFFVSGLGCNQQIDDKPIDTFVELVNKARNKDSMDMESFNAIKEKGRILFKKGNFISKEYFEKLLSYRVSSIGLHPDPDATEILRFVNRRIGEDRWNYCRIELKLRWSGEVVDFYWDYPIDPDVDTIDNEQLEFFMRYVDAGDYYGGIVEKGHQLFKENRKLPENYKDVFRKYLRDEKDDMLRYNFYNESGQGGFASASLFVDSKAGKVICFQSISGS